MTDEQQRNDSNANNNQGANRNRINRRTYRETLRWATFAALQGLARLVPSDPAIQVDPETPSTIVLDDQLTYDPTTPWFWVRPHQEGVGPLDPEKGGRLGQKNGFFKALRDWRPSAGMAALQLPYRYRLNYELDENHRYVRTVLHLLPPHQNEGFNAYIPQIRAKPDNVTTN